MSPRHRWPAAFSFSWALAAAASALAGDVRPAPPAVHALLISGGDRPGSNYLSHLHHLEDMVALLRRRGVAPERMDVFSADGEDPAADLTTRDVPPPDFWILEGTSLGKRLRPQPRLVDTRWAGVTLHPARQAALRAWFEAARTRIVPGDQLLVFVTDHGTGDARDPENNAISLWQEKLTVRELRALLARLAPGVQVVLVMSQCFSGAFANVLGEAGPSGPSADVCGFFSTTANQKAYGCYAEGRDRDKVGHAFHFIEALGRAATAAAAHVEVLVDDDTPDVPLRTTDAYLARVVAAEASSRQQSEDTLVDALLAKALRTPATWEPDLRLIDRIGTAFGTFSPRRVAEVRAREKELEEVTRQMSSHAERWKAALVARQESVLQDYLAGHDEWRVRLDARALDGLTDEGRAALREEVLPLVLDHARRRADLWARLETFRSNSMRGEEARWRLEVRKAALQRMRTVLVGVAGRALLRGDPRAQALARLQRCEAFTAGDPAGPATVARASTSVPFPPMKEELATLAEIAPAWLGVQFRAVPTGVRTARGLPGGANLLDAIYPDSPAGEAGLQVGDIVLGPPGQPFRSPSELREWTMTSPRGVPLPLAVVRPAAERTADQTFEATLVLRTVPSDLPALSTPALVGERAPVLSNGLRPVGSSALPDLKGHPYVLFFWATWCGPCKKAVPEVLAFSEKRGLPVVAISDEDEETVKGFLAARTDAFFPEVVVDPLRNAFVSYGVSGTPTMLLVDADGVIRHRQVGYLPETGLTIAGWSWAGR